MGANAKQSKADRLTERLNRYPSEGRLLLARNLAFGGAAACLVVLSQIIQVGAKDPALEISVIGSAAGIPLWIAIGSIYEFFIMLGKQSYPYLRRPGIPAAIGGVMFFAGAGLLTAVGGAIWYLSQIAFLAFVGSIALSIASAVVFQWFLAQWWYRTDGPGVKEMNDRDT